MPSAGAPSYYAQRNQPGYSNAYGELQARYDRLPREVKAQISESEFIAQMMTEMFGTLDPTGIDREIGIQNPVEVGSYESSVHIPGSSGEKNAFLMGEQFEAGNEMVSKQGGLAPSSVYTKDPNYERYMNMLVHWDNAPSARDIINHPYAPGQWGGNSFSPVDSYMGKGFYDSENTRRNQDAEFARNRFSDRQIAGSDAIRRAMDRIKRTAWYARNRRR